MGDNRKRRKRVACDCPSSAPAWPDCCVERQQRALEAERQAQQAAAYQRAKAKAHALQDEAARQAIEAGKHDTLVQDVQYAEYVPPTVEDTDVPERTRSMGIAPSRGMGVDSPGGWGERGNEGGENSGPIDSYPTSPDPDYRHSPKTELMAEARAAKSARRQKHVRTAQAFAAEHAEEALRTLIGLMRDSGNPKLQKEAACELLDRGIGKAQLASFLDESSGDDTDVSDEELDRMLTGDA